MNSPATKAGVAPWLDDELAVLAALVAEYPERDAATGRRVDVNDRFRSIRAQLTSRLPDLEPRGKTELRDCVQALKRAAGSDDPTRTPNDGGAWTAEESRVLAELIEEFPDRRDASGQRVDANERYGTIRKEMARRLPGNNPRGKTEIRAHVKLLTSGGKASPSPNRRTSSAKQLAAEAGEAGEAVGGEFCVALNAELEQEQKAAGAMVDVHAEAKANARAEAARIKAGAQVARLAADEEAEAARVAAADEAARVATAAAAARDAEEKEAEARAVAAEKAAVVESAVAKARAVAVNAKAEAERARERKDNALAAADAEAARVAAAKGANERQVGEGIEIEMAQTNIDRRPRTFSKEEDEDEEEEEEEDPANPAAPIPTPREVAELAESKRVAEAEAEIEVQRQADHATEQSRLAAKKDRMRKKKADARQKRLEDEKLAKAQVESARTAEYAYTVGAIEHAFMSTETEEGRAKAEERKTPRLARLAEEAIVAMGAKLWHHMRSGLGEPAQPTRPKSGGKLIKS